LRERGLALGIVAGTNVAANRISALFPGQSFRELLPFQEWAGAFGRLISDASANVVYTPVLLMMLLAGVVTLGLRRKWDARLAIGVAACAQIGVASLSEWVARNGSDSRYIVPPLFVLGILAAGVVVYPLTNAVRRFQSPAAVIGIASLLIVAVATRAFGFPSPVRGTRYLEEATRPAAESFGSDRCTHMIGDYWRVWMAVYHDMLAGRKPPRHGVTFRSEVTRNLWDREPQEVRTYCGACADPTLEYFRVQQGVPALTKTSREAAVCHWTAK
jgi:hypothetical protein